MAQTSIEDHDYRDVEDRLLPWPKVKDITGLSRTTAWRLQKAGDFPPPVVISPGRVGWRESELQAWKASRAPRELVTVRPRAERSFQPEVEKHDRESQPPVVLPQTSSTRPRHKTTGAADQLRFEF